MKRKRKCDAPAETLLAIYNPQFQVQAQQAADSPVTKAGARKAYIAHAPLKPQPRRAQSAQRLAYSAPLSEAAVARAGRLRWTG